MNTLQVILNSRKPDDWFMEEREIEGVICQDIYLKYNSKIYHESQVSVMCRVERITISKYPDGTESGGVFYPVSPITNRPSNAYHFPADIPLAMLKELEYDIITRDDIRF